MQSRASACESYLACLVAALLAAARVDAREIAEDRVAVEEDLGVRNKGQEVLWFKAGGGGAGARKLADKAHGPVVSCGDGAAPDSRTGKGVPGVTFAFA